MLRLHRCQRFWSTFITRNSRDAKLLIIIFRYSIKWLKDCPAILISSARNWPRFILKPDFFVSMWKRLHSWLIAWKFKFSLVWWALWMGSVWIDWWDSRNLEILTPFLPVHWRNVLASVKFWKVLLQTLDSPSPPLLQTMAIMMMKTMMIIEMKQ